MESKILNLEQRMEIMEAIHAEVLNRLQQAKNPKPVAKDVKRRELETDKKLS
jgi:hypothetical protein